MPRKKPHQTSAFGSTPRAKTQDSNPFFFMASVLVMYEREETVRQRHLNLLFEAPQPAIRKEDLNSLHRSALARIHAENDVSPDQVKDIVFLNMFLLGCMPSETFYGPQPKTS
jgi:hypothetical protein